MPRRFVAIAIVVAIAPAMFGCSSGGGDEQTLVVFAASSLTDSFTEIAEAFEDETDGVRILLNFAGSSALREQVSEGAPADVVATADPETMAPLVDAGLVSEPEFFAGNELVVVSRSDLDTGGASVPDVLGDGSLLVGLCAEQVPCGRLARQVLAELEIEPAPDTEEPDVRRLLSKVVEGELDLAVVYRTDALSAEREVTVHDLVTADGRTPLQNRTRYPIASVADSDVTSLAAEFVEFVRGPTAQRILSAHGFTPIGR